MAHVGYEPKSLPGRFSGRGGDLRIELKHAPARPALEMTMCGLR